MCHTPAVHPLTPYYLQIDKLNSEAKTYRTTQVLLCEQLATAGQSLTETERQLNTLETVQQQLADSDTARQQLQRQLEELQALQQQRQQQEEDAASDKQQLAQQLAQAEVMVQQLQQELAAMRAQQHSQQQRHEGLDASGWDESATIGGDADDADSGTAAAALSHSERPASGTPAGSRNELAKQVRAQWGHDEEVVVSLLSYCHVVLLW